MIPSVNYYEEPPLKEINSRIEKVSKCIKNLHEDCPSELESDVLLAEIKTEKLKALAATARTQALLAEMEMLNIAKQLKQQINKAKLNDCKCSKQSPQAKTPTKSSHKSQVTKLYSNKNSGKVQKPVRNQTKLFTNSKYKTLLNAGINNNNNNTAENKHGGDNNNNNNIDVTASKLNVAAKSFVPNSVVPNLPNPVCNVPVVSDSSNVAVKNGKHNIAINESLVTAASLAIYKPIRPNLARKKADDGILSSKNGNTDTYTSRSHNIESSSKFNENVAKFFGSKAAKTNNHLAINKTSGDQTNILKSKNVLESNKNIQQATESNTNKPGDAKTNTKPASTTHKSSGTVRTTILLDIDRDTTATKENKYHRYGQTERRSSEKHGRKHGSNNDKKSKKPESLKVSLKVNNLHEILKAHGHTKSSTSDKLTDNIVTKPTSVDNVSRMDTDTNFSKTDPCIVCNNELANNIVPTNQSISKSGTKDLDKIGTNDAVSQKKSVLNIFAKDLTFDRIEILDCEPMDVDTDDSFREETVENIRKEMMKMNEAK